MVAYNIIQKKIGDIESNATAITKQVSAFLKAHPFHKRESDERTSHRGFAVVEGHG